MLPKKIILYFTCGFSLLTSVAAETASTSMTSSSALASWASSSSSSSPGEEDDPRASIEKNNKCFRHQFCLKKTKNVFGGLLPFPPLAVVSSSLPTTVVDTSAQPVSWALAREEEEGEDEEVGACRRRVWMINSI